MFSCSSSVCFSFSPVVHWCNKAQMLVSFTQSVPAGTVPPALPVHFKKNGEPLLLYLFSQQQRHRGCHSVLHAMAPSPPPDCWNTIWTCTLGLLYTIFAWFYINKQKWHYSLILVWKGLIIFRPAVLIQPLVETCGLLQPQWGGVFPFFCRSGSWPGRRWCERWRL